MLYIHGLRQLDNLGVGGNSSPHVHFLNFLFTSLRRQSRLSPTQKRTMLPLSATGMGRTGYYHVKCGENDRLTCVQVEKGGQ